jgi:hypothetical protein
MRNIRRMGLAAVLALTALVAVSAAASASSRAVTIEGHGTGAIRLDPATGSFTGEESGISSHLGRYTLRLQGVGSSSADGTFTGTGTVTIVASNGDQLRGTFTVTGRGDTNTVVVTITGGTGRFADATGTLTVICLSEPPLRDGATLVSKHSCTMNGIVSR